MFYVVKLYGKPVKFKPAKTCNTPTLQIFILLEI